MHGGLRFTVAHLLVSLYHLHATDAASSYLNTIVINFVVSVLTVGVKYSVKKRKKSTR